MLWFQGDLLLVVLGDLLPQGVPVIGTAVGVVPGILVAHVQLLVAVREVVLSLSHVALQMLIELRCLLELRL